MNTAKSEVLNDVKETDIEDIIKALLQKTTNPEITKQIPEDPPKKLDEVLEGALTHTQNIENFDDTTLNVDLAINKVGIQTDLAKVVNQFELLSTDVIPDTLEDFINQCKGESSTDDNNNTDCLLPNELNANNTTVDYNSDENLYDGDNNMAATINIDGAYFDDIDDGSSEGACALLTHLTEQSTQCHLAQQKPETIKYTTPQHSDDSDDQSMTAKPLNNDDNLVTVTNIKLNSHSNLVPQLVYFNVRGIGEPLRMLFAYCKITYHDVRLTRDEWHELKKTLPNCQIPMLVIGDKVIQHVVPIARYLGTLGGINGDTPLEVLQIDGIVETLNEFRHQILQAYYELDVRLKRRKVRSMHTHLVPTTMREMEKHIVENDGYLVLNKLTWADIFFVGLIEYLSYVSEYNLIDDFPAMCRHAHMVKKLRGIRQWIKIRPETDV